MKKFKAFITEIDDVLEGAYPDRFTWAPEDVQFAQPVLGEDISKKAHGAFMAHDMSLPGPVHNSIHHFKMAGYRHINKGLRTNKGDVSKFAKPSQKHIQNLEHATSHRTTSDHVVYRGGARGSAEHFPVGSEFTDHGFASASLKKDVAAGFSKEKKRDVVHVLHLPKGTKAHHLDLGSATYSHEKEMLLDRGTRFKVTKHTKKDGMTHVHSTVVGQRDHEAK